MGSWSEDIFGNDMACDIRDAYRERIVASDSAEAAFKHVKKEFADALRDADDKRVIYIALAAAQLEAGIVTDTVRETALKAIAWCENSNRDSEEFPFSLESLAKLREQLGGTPLSAGEAPKTKLPPGEPGEVYVITLPKDGFVAKEIGSPSELVIFVGERVEEGGRQPVTSRVVLLPDLVVAEVTSESVTKALSAWRHYRQQWPNGLGRSILCYDVRDKLPPRKSRLLLRDVPMPEVFARRMRGLGVVCKAAELPFVIDHDFWDWKRCEWAIDPERDSGD